MHIRINLEAPIFGWVERSVGILWLMRTGVLVVRGDYISTPWIVLGVATALVMFGRLWLVSQFRSNEVAVQICRYTGDSQGLTDQHVPAVMMGQLCEHCCHEMVESQEDGSVRMEAMSIAHGDQEAHYWHVKCWQEAGEPLVGT